MTFTGNGEYASFSNRWTLSVIITAQNGLICWNLGTWFKANNNTKLSTLWFFHFFRIIFRWSNYKTVVLPQRGRKETSPRTTRLLVLYNSIKAYSSFFIKVKPPPFSLKTAENKRQTKKMAGKTGHVVIFAISRLPYTSCFSKPLSIFSMNERKGIQNPSRNYEESSWERAICKIRAQTIKCHRRILQFERRKYELVYHCEGNLVSFWRTVKRELNCAFSLCKWFSFPCESNFQ